MHDYRILIGAVGWQHPRWQAEYYPDGLPPEWQLGFYGNEFRVILLPAVAWPNDIAQVMQWLADSGDTLVFLCELPLARCDEACWHQNDQILKAFGERLLGVIIPLAGVTKFPGLPAELAKRFRVCIDAGVQTELAVQMATTDVRLGICWHGAGPADGLAHGQLAIARINAAGMTPRGIRAILEALLAAEDPQRYLVFLVDGTPPPIEVMRQAQVMMELL